MKARLNVLSVIIGTMIGAGFASGKEIYLFFGCYGKQGLYGILLSCFLTSLFIYKMFLLLSKHEITSYYDFLQLLLGKFSHSTFLIQVVQAIINLFLLISFFIMVAGFGAYFSQEFSFAPIFGCLILALLCFFTFRKTISGILKANTLLIPLLILFICFLGIKNIPFLQNYNGIAMMNCSSGNWIIDAILYSSYNSILLFPILITLRNYIKEKKACLFLAIDTFTIFSLLSLCIFTLLFRLQTPIDNLEIPMLFVANSFGLIYQYGYGLIILVSIFTSAISAGYSFLQNFKNPKAYCFMTFAICLVSIFVSPFGFSSLVSVLYPLFGYLGLLQISLLLLKKTRKTDIKKRVN